MDSLRLAFTVIFPLLCLMSLGYLLRKANLIDAPFLKKANNLVFKILLPALIFINVYSSDFGQVFSLKLIIYAHGKL